MQLHLGTYEHSGGEGLVPLRLSPNGTLAAGEPYRLAHNASFGLRHGKLLYVVDEQDEGTLDVHGQTRAGWERLACVPTGGAAPCHLALDPAGRRLAVANYESGSVVLYALGPHGLPVGPPALFHNEGSGPDRERQEGPHAHCVRFHEGALYLVDLGADQVLRMELTASGLGEARVAWTAPAGAGPRHLLFAPSSRQAVLLCELAATLTLLEAGPLGLETRLTLPTAPDGFAGANLGGHLELSADGRRVYVSNRGHDSIAVFALDRNRLELLQHVPSGGEHPRHFAFVGEKLVVAHEKDGRVTAFDLAPDGTLVPCGDGLVVPGTCFVLA